MVPINTTSSVQENTTTEGASANRTTNVNTTLLASLVMVVDQIQDPATAKEAIRAVIRAAVNVGLSGNEASALLTEATFKS